MENEMQVIERLEEILSYLDSHGWDVSAAHASMALETLKIGIAAKKTEKPDSDSNCS